MKKNKKKDEKLIAEKVEEVKEDLNKLDEEIEEDIDKEEFFDEKKPSKKKKIIIIVLISCLILVVIGIIIGIKLLTPTIKLNGSKEIKLTLNSEYYDEGSIAKKMGKDISSKIEKTGSVNTKKAGTYEITYKVKSGFLKASTKRKVIVVKEGPVITLEGDQTTTICPDAKYEEIGFKAVDSKENDLTKKVVSTPDKDIIKYTVKDKNNISYTITRKIVREDKEAPEINLNGNDHVYVTLGMNYNEQGATANDKCDGDLTDKIEVSGNVDTSNLGDYKLTYKVVDKNNNEATKERTVTVQRQIVKRSASLGCGEPGVIYLTFDDGPNSTYTPQILSVLKKYNVKATFFVTNNGPSELVKREYEEGHQIALHTASHDYGRIYSSDEAYWNDLNSVNNTVEKITGKKSYLVRFPGGSSNTVSRHYSTGIMSRLANDLESKGYSYFDWNVDSRDAEGKGCDAVYSYATGGLSKSVGNVILMHDIKPATACAIERIVQFGLNNGYTFKTLNSSVVCHHKTAN